MCICIINKFKKKINPSACHQWTLWVTQTMESPWRYGQALGKHRNEHVEQAAKYSTGSCHREYIFCNANQLEGATLNWRSVSIDFHNAAVSFLATSLFVERTGEIVCLEVLLGAGTAIAMLRWHRWKDCRKKYGHQGLYSCCRISYVRLHSDVA